MMNQSAFLPTEARQAIRPTTGKEPRYGIVWAKVGSTHAHRIGIEGSPLGRRGKVTHVTVQDVTRLPEDQRKAAKYVCRHPDCGGIAYGTKGELLEAHPQHWELVRDKQTHLCVGVIEAPEEKPRPATKGKGDQPDQPAVEGKPPTIMLVSDEVG